MSSSRRADAGRFRAGGAKSVSRGRTSVCPIKPRREASVPQQEVAHHPGERRLLGDGRGLGLSPVVQLFVSSSGFQLRQRFFSHVARKGFRFGKGVPLSLFGFAS